MKKGVSSVKLGLLINKPVYPSKSEFNLKSRFFHLINRDNQLQPHNQRENGIYSSPNLITN